MKRMRRPRWAAGAAVLLVAPLVAGAHGPTQRPTFQAGVEVVRLGVSVMDARNRYVTDLSEGDFAVFEDGVPSRWPCSPATACRFRWFC